MTKFLPFIWVAIVALILMLGYAKNRLSKLEKENSLALKELKELRLENERILKNESKNLEIIKNSSSKKEKLNIDINRAKDEIYKGKDNEKVSNSIKYASDFILARLHKKNSDSKAKNTTGIASGTNN
ncbi:MAG: hypothetical protein MR902_01740 [Campylobacter sp.]|nr:hypothetical protein [Campylobacter sp.]